MRTDVERAKELAEMAKNDVEGLQANTPKVIHWVCYKKVDDTVYYFDSFGHLRPPPGRLRCLNFNVWVLKYLKILINQH